MRCIRRCNRRCNRRCKQSKSSDSGKTSNNRGKDNREGTGIGDVSHPAKDAPFATPRGVPPVPLPSPSGITHAARRPLPPQPPAYPSFPTNENFLDADPFSQVVQPENRTGSPSKERDGAGTGDECEYVSLNKFNCDSPLDALERERFARYLPDVALFKPSSTSYLVGSILLSNQSENTDQRVEFVTHEPERSAFQQTGSLPAGRIQNNPNFYSAKEKFIEGTKPVQDTMVNSCLHSRKVQLQDCTNGDYDLYRDSCGIGNYRGEDEDFFVNHASNPQAPDSPNHNKTTDHDVRQRDSSEETIQKQSLLHPEVSLAEKPDAKYQNTIKDYGRIGEEAASLLDIPPAEDNPTALREYRLSLLFQDDAATTPVVPQARLSRALNERDLQDLTMNNLHEEFFNNKEVLANTQGEVKNSDRIAKEQQSAIEDFKVKLFADKQWLHGRLQRESEENSMLQTRLMTLQQEVRQLRSSLRSAAGELTKSSNNAMEESQNALTSRASGRGADPSDKDSALISLLRSEISDLKEQLESPRMHSNRLLSSQECDHAVVTRLKCQLERAAVELLTLKRAQIAQTAMSDKATEELRTALAHSENALRIANKNKHLLSNELENTKDSLASLEISSRAYRDESVHEIRDLKLRIGTVELEAELAQRSALDALELCRMEADESRSEVQRTLRALDEEKNRAHNEASERTKERLEFECKLNRSEEKEKYVAEKMKSLEECLAKSNREASARTKERLEFESKLKRSEENEKYLAEKITTLEECLANSKREASEETKERLEFECQLKRSEENEKYFAEKITTLEDCLAKSKREASEQAKERLEFECQLKRSEENEKYFAEKIKTLEDCLAKSKREAIPRLFASEDRALKFQYDGAAAEKALVEQLVASEVGRLYRGLRKMEEEESRLKAKVKQLTNKVQHAQAHAAMAKQQAVCLTRDATGMSSELERDIYNLKVQLAEETAKAAMTENEREVLEAKLHNVLNREASLEQEMISLKSRLESSEAKVYDEMLRADEEQRIAVEADAELVKEINLLKSKLHHVSTSNTAPGSMIELERKATDVPRKVAKSVSDREVLATIKADFTIEALGEVYEEALPFASSRSDESSSNSTIPNGAGYPVSTGSTHFLSASRSSPQKVRFHSVARDTMPLLTEKASPRTRGSCHFCEDLIKHTSQKMNTFSPDSNCDLPPSLPPRDTRTGLPPSQVAIPSNVVEGDNSSADFRNGIEDIRKMSNRRHDIMQIQRRLIQSTERLTAAKSKLQVLADDCDENREDQHTLKIKADKITEQCKRATDKSICRQPTNVETMLCTQPTNIETMHYTSPDARNSCADRVLERYRLYKASRLQMSPGKSKAIIDYR